MHFRIAVRMPENEKKMVLEKEIKFILAEVKFILTRTFNLTFNSSFIKTISWYYIKAKLYLET